MFCPVLGRETMNIGGGRGKNESKKGSRKGKKDERNEESNDVKMKR